MKKVLGIFLIAIMGVAGCGVPVMREPAGPLSLDEDGDLLLKATTSKDSTTIKFENVGDETWYDVKAIINVNTSTPYWISVEQLESHHYITCGLFQFHDKNGNRFNPFEVKVMTLSIHVLRVEGYGSKKGYCSMTFKD